MNQAILHLFTLLGRQNKILVSAPTVAAAVLIGGYTIHSLLLLPNEDNPDLQTLAVIWENIIYLIIDEISMVSAALLSAICSHLQHAKGWSVLAEDQPFGGVNVIFLGDFGQLRPVSSPSLYSHRYIKEPTVQDAQHKSTLATFKGVCIWRSVCTVVMLRNNQRQSKDTPYSNMLSRIQEGHSGLARYQGTAYNFCILQKRLIQNFDGPTCSRFVNAPVIIGRKSIRDALNRVDVISVPSCNLVAALKHFWASLVINFLRPNLAVCGIPLTTLECVGILKPVMTAKDEKATDKYGIRGFDLLVDPSLPDEQYWESPFFSTKRALVVPYRRTLQEHCLASPLIRINHGWALVASWPHPASEYRPTAPLSTAFCLRCTF